MRVRNKSRSITTVHGEVEGGRSKGEARSRRSPVEVQSSARMMSYGGVEGGAMV